MLSMIFGEGLTKGMLEKETYRNSFSDYLPYLAYDEETKVYVNHDETIGFIWECSPLYYAGERTYTSLEGLIRFPFPEGSVLQFALYADNHIDPFLDYYRSLKTRDNPLIRETTERYCKFLKEGIKGVESLSGIPIRNFRLFVSVKIPLKGKEIGSMDYKDIYETTEDRLKGALLYPVPLPPEGLLAFLRRLFNGSMNNAGVYDDTIPMNKQIILSETVIEKSLKKLTIGDRIFKCITPKTFPKEVDALRMNNVVGGIYGVISDAEQIKTPFLYTVNVVFKDLKGILHTKCNFILQQHAVGSFAPSLKRKQEEYLWATDNLERGVNFYQIIPAIWVFDQDEKTVAESVARVKRIWEGYGFIMQEDAGILPILFISSLPFGLYTIGNNVSTMDRDFIAHTTAIARVLPVQADFTGNGATMILLGRKGQLTGIDLFSKGTNNYNAVVSASSGSGKSFLVNYIVFNNYANNAIIRLVDIGGSYKKLVRMLGAKYIDFDDRESPVCLNPFSFVKDPEYDLPVITPVLSQMVYTAEKRIPSQTEYTILQNAIQWAYSQEGDNASIDTVYQYLNSFPKHAANFDFDCPEKQECATDIKTLAHTLAFNIYDFTSDGMYGKYFNGKATFDISNDELVVLELERLKTMPDLFNVVTLQVINAIAADLYLSNREKPRITIFDEAWQFMNETSHLKMVIEEGYRKARKYYGSFIVVFQSDLDLIQAGSVGKVIMGNSAFKFKLESGDYERAKAENLLDYDEFTMKILKSVRTNKPYYSEVFVDSNAAIGVARLCVDPYSYYIYTSAPDEIVQIEKLIDGGMSYAEAIEEMVKRYRK